MRLAGPITARPLKGGFFYVPAAVAAHLPTSGRAKSVVISADLDGLGETELRLLSKANCITGLTRWYRLLGAKVGDEVQFELRKRRPVRMTLSRRGRRVKPPSRKHRLLDEATVQTAVLLKLADMRFSVGRRYGSKRTHGVDIRVRHKDYSRYFLVEVKGDPSSSSRHPDSVREVYFVQALGQIVSRMDTAAGYRYGLGFPASYERRVMQRVPWRLAKKLSLSVFLVLGDLSVRVVGWKELRSAQTA